MTVDGATVLRARAASWHPAARHRAGTRTARRGPRARLSLPLLYEDETVLVVDKPAGLLAVPTAPGRDGRGHRARARAGLRRAACRPRRPYVGRRAPARPRHLGRRWPSRSPRAARPRCATFPRAPHRAALRRPGRRASPRGERGQGRPAHPRRLRGRAGGAWRGRASRPRPRSRAGRVVERFRAGGPARGRAGDRAPAPDPRAPRPHRACPSSATPSTARPAGRRGTGAPARCCTRGVLALRPPLDRRAGARRRARCPRTSAAVTRLRRGRATGAGSPRRRARSSRAPATADAPRRRGAELAQLGQDPVLDPVRVPPLPRVHLLALQDHREVQVVAAGQARRLRSGRWSGRASRCRRPSPRSWLRWP